MNSSRHIAFKIFAFSLMVVAAALLAGDSRAQSVEKLSLSNLAIPASLGKIEERFEGKASRWVIYIQDVHAHFTAQENIAAILDHLNEIYGIKTVGLEGGWLSTSFPKSWGIPGSAKKQMLARNLLEDAYLTGPGYAALFSQTPITLIGIEEASLYEQNRQVYLKYLPARENTLAKIRDLEKKFETEKSTVYNPALFDFDRLLVKFRDGKKTAEFLPAFMTLCQNKGANLKGLDQIALFLLALKAEQAIDRKKLEAESDRLMEQYKTSHLTLEELVRSGKIPADQIELFPQAKSFLALLKIQDRLRPSDFASELDKAIGRLKEKLFVSEDERKLDQRFENFRTLRSILTFQATPDDLTNYGRHKKEADAEIWDADLTNELNLALQFYDLAKQRDDIFSEKIFKDPGLAGDIAVVTGGFHADGLRKKLRAANVSYIVISPNLAGEAPDEALYFKKLQEGPAAKQTLQFYLQFLEERFDQQFFDAVKALTSNQTNDLGLAAAQIEGRAVTGRRSVVRTPIKAAPSSITMEDFLKLTPPEQKARIGNWAQTVQSGNVPIGIVVRLEIMKDYLSDSLNLSTWNAFKADRTHTTWILMQAGDDVPTELIGGQARIHRETATDPNQFLQIPRIRQQVSRLQQRVGLIEKSDYKTSVVLFPPIRGILLIVPPILSGQLQISSDLNIQSQFWIAIQNLLANFTSLEEVTTSV